MALQKEKIIQIATSITSDVDSGVTESIFALTNFGNVFERVVRPFGEGKNKEWKTVWEKVTLPGLL